MTTEITQERVIHVLLLGERVEEFRRVRELLQGQGNFHVHGARDAMSAAGLLAEGAYDAVLVDSEIWEDAGSILLEQMRRNECTTAVVVITNHEGAGGLGSKQGHGAHEVVRRETLDDGEQLSRRIAEAARRLHSTKRDTMLRWLVQDARADALTGLNNTHTFERLLAERCDDSKLSAVPVTLVLASVYGHAAIARTYGEQAGDELLRRAATCVSYCVRGNDFAARIGCDTFAVLIDGASVEVAQMVARRIVHRMHQENAEDGTRSAPIEVAFGIASGVAPAASDLIAAAMAQIETQRPAQDGPVPLMYSDDEDGPSVA
jgi:diguanylate cyclase (GGDEF)-like protein